MQRHVTQSEAVPALDGQSSEPFVERPEEVPAPVDEPANPARKRGASAWLTALVVLALGALLIVKARRRCR